MKDNIVKATCKELGITQKELIKRCEALRNVVVEALYIYAKDELQDVNLASKDKKEVVERCEYLNNFTSDDEESLKQTFIKHLKGEQTIEVNGMITGSIEDVFPAMRNIDSNPLTKSKTKQIITNEEIEIVTPLKLKEWLKERKWGYRDIAEAIGASEGTIKNWVIKGEIPEWAKKSISYIQKYEALQVMLNESNDEIRYIKEHLQDFKKLLNNI